MNELSWLIYAADVVGTLKGLSFFVALGGTIGLVIFSVGKLIALDTGYSATPITPSFGAIYKSTVPYVAAAAVLTALVPSSSTVYAIAASEMGESVLNSETGGKAVEALNAWLDRQIAGNGGAQ